MEDYSDVGILSKRSATHRITIDQNKFVDRSKWLTDYNIFRLDGTPILIPEAFEQAYQFSTDDLEKQISEIITENCNLDPPIQSYDDVPIEKQQLGSEEENALLEWYFQTRPTHCYFQDDVYNKSIKELIPISTRSIGKIVKCLREKFFRVLYPSNYWEKLIANAHVTMGDKISPLTVFKEYQLPETQIVKLGLNSLSEDASMTFDNYLDLVPAETFDFPYHSNPKSGETRLNRYKSELEWILQFRNWKKSKTLTQIQRFKLRCTKDNPWGKKIALENTLWIRRRLESLKIKPPKNVDPYPEPLDIEKIAPILDQQYVDHIFKRLPNMIPWYCEVNNKILSLRPIPSSRSKKAKIIPNEYEILKKKAEYATFYDQWIRLDNYWVKFQDDNQAVQLHNLSFSVLEAVEIAYYGKTYGIIPELTTQKYQIIFENLILKYSQPEEIQNFPVIPNWNAEFQDSMLNTLQQCQPQYSMALRIMFKIQQQQKKIKDNIALSIANNQRQAAQLELLTRDQWEDIKGDHLGEAKKSWITGNMLSPGNYQMVLVESSNHQDYRY